MRKRDCEWIKRNLLTIQANLPREPKFQITFADILRLYGDYVTREELKNCLNELEKEDMLRRKNISDTYFFINEIKRRLSFLNIENQKIIEKMDRRKKELDAIQKLQDLWLERLPLKQVHNSQIRTLKYFISIYWQTKFSIERQKLNETEERMEKIMNEIYELKKICEKPE